MSAVIWPLIRERLSRGVTRVTQAHHPDRMIEIHKCFSAANVPLHAVQQMGTQNRRDATCPHRHLSSFTSSAEALRCAEFVFSRWTEADSENSIGQNGFGTIARVDRLRPMSELHGSVSEDSWKGNIAPAETDWICDGATAMRASAVRPRFLTSLKKQGQGQERRVSFDDVAALVRRAEVKAFDARVLGYGDTWCLIPLAHAVLSTGPRVALLNAHKLALIQAAVPGAVMRLSQNREDPAVFLLGDRPVAFLMAVELSEWLGPDLFTADEARARAADV